MTLFSFVWAAAMAPCSSYLMTLQIDDFAEIVSLSVLNKFF
jgi:hypothetical protein